MPRMLAPIFVILFLICPLRTPAQGETTSAIDGQVRDVTAAPIAGANVTITNRDTGLRRSLKTDERGRFNFPQLKPGTYLVKIEAEGFDPQENDTIFAGLGQKQTVNCALKVAQARQTIEIIAVAPLINPENQNTSTNLNAPAVENLPNPGGDLTYLLQFAPGALINTAGSSNDFVGGTNGFGNVEFNGLPALSNGYIVDGLESNDPLAASTALEALSTEADRERKISHFQLRRLLGFQALIEVDAFLKDCGVEREYAAEDLERDRETLEFGCRRA